MNKPILCVDFDGVIHSYENGWQGGEIYGNATPGFFAWLVKAVDHFEIVIYSSRSKTVEGRQAMFDALTKWAKEWATEIGDLEPHQDPEYLVGVLDFSDVKPPAFLTIDDRAICFQGNWSALDPAELLEFRTWTQKTPAGKSFVEDYNHMMGGIADFCNRYDVPKPDVIFHPKMLDKMRSESDMHSMLGTLIFMGIRVRFGLWEQRDVLRSV